MPTTEALIEALYDVRENGKAEIVNGGIMALGAYGGRTGSYRCKASAEPAVAGWVLPVEALFR